MIIYFGGSSGATQISYIYVSFPHPTFPLKAVASDISYSNIYPSPLPSPSAISALFFLLFLLKQLYILFYPIFLIFTSHILSRQHFLTYPKLYTHWQTSVRDMCPPRRLEIQHSPG